MSMDEDLIRCLDEQFVRVHAKLDRILSEMTWTTNTKHFLLGDIVARGQRWRAIEAGLERLWRRCKR